MRTAMAVLLSFVGLLACGDSTPEGPDAADGAVPDGGDAMAPDAGRDAAVDAGPDGGSDAGAVCVEPDAASRPECAYGFLQLHGFELRHDTPDRVYFESTVPFTASLIDGFVVPDDLSSNTPSGEPHFANAITGVSVSEGRIAGHYFTLEHPYFYGDNVLIKYDGGADFTAAGGAQLAAFTHRSVANQIEEPSYDGDVYYVDVATGDDGNTGLESTAAFETITWAARIAEAGDIVYIKAGDYGAEHVIFENSGTRDQRILFEGYQTTPGDSPDIGWAYGGGGLDSSAMPLLDGGNRNAGFGLDLFENANDYVTIRNVQLTNYREAVRGRNNRYLVLENIIAENLGRDGYSGHGFTFIGISYNNTIRRGVVLNATATAYRVYGFFNRVIDSVAYCDEFDGDAGGDAEPTDYYTTFRGDWNHVAGVHLERVGDLEHGGHGITFKGDRDLGLEIGSVANNLAEDSTIVHMNGSVELRHRQVRFNTVRNIHIGINEEHALGRTGGIDIRDGARNNIVEGCIVDGVKDGLSFFDTSEDQGAQSVARDNIIRNTTFSNLASFGVRMDSYRAGTDDLVGNKVLHCVFFNVPTLFAGLHEGEVSDNVFAGNIVSVVATEGRGQAAFSQRHSNYSDGFAVPAGEGNIGGDPRFRDPGAGDFSLGEGSPCIDTVADDYAVDDDRDGRPRPLGGAYDIGASESPPAP